MTSIRRGTTCGSVGKWRWGACPNGTKTPIVDDLISVIVTTYEREDALGAVLRSLARQRDRNFEVLVADDGSGPRTAALMKIGRRGFALY